MLVGFLWHPPVMFATADLGILGMPPPLRVGEAMGEIWGNCVVDDSWGLWRGGGGDGRPRASEEVVATSECRRGARAPNPPQSAWPLPACHLARGFNTAIPQSPPSIGSLISSLLLLLLTWQTPRQLGHGSFFTIIRGSSHLWPKVERPLICTNHIARNHQEFGLSSSKAVII